MRTEGRERSVCSLFPAIEMFALKNEEEPVSNLRQAGL